MATPLLDDLLSGFTITRAQAWLRSVFASYDASVNIGVSLDRNNKNEIAYFQSIRSLGLVRALPETEGSHTNRPLAVIAVEMKDNLTERTSRAIQFRLAKRLLELCARQAIPGLTASITQGLFFFYTADGSAYRFSLVSGNFSRRALKLNEAKRQSFFIDTEKANNVFRRRFTSTIKSYTALLEAFSVESLTKEFYDKLFTWFCWATDATTNVTYPNDLSSDTDDRAALSEGIIRLITRLMFVWFVRQKNLIPAALFDKATLPTILKAFESNSMEADNYYRCILQNLFFATLNCPAEKRKFQQVYRGMSNERGVKTCYRYLDEFKDGEAFKAKLHHVPFLNCSLFECLDKTLEDGKVLYIDGFSGKKGRRAHIPNGLFFKEAHTFSMRDAKGKVREVPVCGLIHLFNSFDFTVDENLHNDADIVLDPELLGKVFENLLGAYNPETGESVRSSTGSFYTPREIVDYMVETSLREYLKRQVAEVSDHHLDQLFNKDEDASVTFSYDLTKALLNALYDCKILDPACGSGAYPMGVLQTMVRLLHRLDPYNAEQIKRIESYYNTSCAELETERDDKERAERATLIKQQRDESRTFPDYARKLYLIENCIYGVDIQPIAVQIAKLRFFISLLCDQLKQNYDKDEENYGFLSLPNLETKFVCANTLLRLPSLPSGEDLNLATGDIRELRIDLQRNRKKIFYARTTSTKEKYRQKDKEIRERIRDTICSSGSTPDQHVIATQTLILNQLKADYEKVKDPRWENQIIQNDDLFGMTLSRSFQRVDVNAEKRSTLRQQMILAERKIEAEYKKVHNHGTTALDRLAHKIASWDPYDQNATADFFDPQWMFNIEQGFDIVIGNPPYVQLQTMDKDVVARYQDGDYDTFTKTGDLYCLFYERGVELLKEKALLSYITSNKWMRAGYGESLRGFFATQTNPLQLLDFAGTKIFKSATVDTNILITAKEANAHQTLAVPFKQADASVLSDLFAYVEGKRANAMTAFENGDAWIILSPIEQGIKRKIEAVGTPLKDWDIQINFGIKTGFNDAFIISTEKRNEILANCQSADERQRTEALIRPILRGRDIRRYGYDWADLWLIATFPSRNYDIEEYPSVKKYLASFGPKLEQTGKEYTIDGVKVKSRKKTSNKWFETQDQIGYWKDFSKPKILWKRIGSILRFSYDESDMVGLDSTCIATGSYIKYLAVVLNSKMGHYLLKDSPRTGTGDLLISVQALEPIAIPLPTTEIEKILNVKLDELCTDYSELHQREVNQTVYQLYHLSPEEIDFIEHYHDKPAEEPEETPKKSSKPKSAKAKPTPMPSSTSDDDDYLE